jgi:transposase
MTEPESSTLCPNCAHTVSVPPDWRLVQCPNCGHVIVRMDSDATYD